MIIDDLLNKVQLKNTNLLLKNIFSTNKCKFFIIVVTITSLIT